MKRKRDKIHEDIVATVPEKDEECGGNDSMTVPKRDFDERLRNSDIVYHVSNSNIYNYFIKVSELKNISNAAKELFITQPTLSRQIADFEENLGISLFRRKKSGMELTPEGEIIYKHCKKLLSAYDDFFAKVEELKGDTVGALSIGYSALSESFVVFLNTKANEEYPYVNIRSYRQTNDNIVEKIISMDLDMAFVYGNELKNINKKTNSIFIHKWQKMLMVSCRHPLADRQRINLSELKNEKFVQTSRKVAPVKTDEFFSACNINGFIPNVIRYVDCLNDAIIDVMTYNAISVMPRANYSNILIDKVVFIELDGMDTDYPIHLVWSSNNKNPIIPKYMKVVKNFLKDLPFL